MGGSGSGQSHSKRNTVDDCRSLDINVWMREGIFKPEGLPFGVWTWTRNNEKIASIGFVLGFDSDWPYIRLLYTWNENKKIDYRVDLDATRPNYGGVRWWFICPGQNCKRRVGKLHIAPGSETFLCRTCQGLTYTSCQESHRYTGLYAHIANNLGTTPEAVKRVLSRKG